MGIGQSFQKPEGLVNWAVLAIKVAEWIIDWAVRKDYVGEQFKKYFPPETWPAWWTRVVELLGHPFTQVLIILAGLALIAYGSRVDRSGGIAHLPAAQPTPPEAPRGSSLAELGRIGAEIHFYPPQNTRPERIRALLREAAQMIRDNATRPIDKGDTAELIKRVYVVHSTVPDFLRAAFLLPKWANDYRDFIESEREKRGKDAVPASAASFLERIADRLISDELDETFVLPNSFRQYRETENWPGHTS